MPAPAPVLRNDDALFDVPAVDREIHRSLAARDWPRARDLMTRMQSMSAETAPVIAELLPALEALATGKVADAFFRLAEETTFDSATEDRMLGLAGEALLSAKDRPLAAAAFLASHEPSHQARGRDLQRELGLDTDALAGVVRKRALSHYAERIRADANDAAAWERVAVNALASGDKVSAMEAGRRACAIEPRRRVAAEVVFGLLLRNELTNDAVAWLEQAAKANPTAAWPFVLLSDVYDKSHEWDRALMYAEQALSAAPDDRAAQKQVRTMLTRLQKPHELFAHLEKMAESTLVIAELAELHEAMADLLALRLNSPHEAIELRKRAAFFRDVPQVTAFYWQMLDGEDADDAVFGEVDEFFRVNRLWDDLAQLLLRKAERAQGDGLLAVYDDLALVTTLMKSKDANVLVLALEGEIAVCQDPVVKPQLEARLLAARTSTLEQKEREQAEPPAPAPAPKATATPAPKATGTKTDVPADEEEAAEEAEGGFPIVAISAVAAIILFTIIVAVVLIVLN